LHQLQDQKLECSGVNHMAKDRSYLSCCEGLKPCGMVRLFGETVVDEREIQQSGLFA
jgi:hypothetical protein